jgi:hypothetical protein
MKIADNHNTTFEKDLNKWEKYFYSFSMVLGLFHGKTNIFYNISEDRN